MPSAKRTKDSPKRQREQAEDPEKKRIRKGGPPAIPPSWRNRPAQELVMSFTSPEVQDGYTLVVLQSSSQVPAFGRYSIPYVNDIRENRVSDNRMGHEHLWAPPTNPFWDVCRNKRKVLQYGMAASHKECSLCIGAKAFELVPCCWCTNWIHVRCSYAVPEGRACAAHFDVVNPLDKQVIASKLDEVVPEAFRGRSICPNIATPRITESSGKEDDKIQPKHVMYGIEAFWLYKHAWRGAGLYYRNGDHQVPKSETTNKPSSMYKALNMYPVWDKWLMPRCEPIAERFYNDPKKWSLSSYDDDDCFGGDISDLPPMGYIQFEYRIAESLDFREGNLFRLWYEMLRKDEKTYWHISRSKAEQRIEYKWDDFIADKKAGNLPAEVQYEPVVDFDPRFHYYDAFKDTVEDLPDASTKEQEEAKSTIWEIEGLELELCMAMDPESFAAKAMNPKKRKPDPETEGEGISTHPAAKRKPDGGNETPKASTSASPSASQDPQPVDTETPSESRSVSAIGVIEPPRVRPSHTPVSTVEGTDAERQDEAVAQVNIMETDLDNAPLDVMTPEEQLISGNPVRDIQTLIYHAHPGLVSVRELIDPVIANVISQLKPQDSIETEDRLLREFLPNCFEDTWEYLFNSADPIDDEVQNSFGLAVEVFPQLMPRAFSTLRKIFKSMAAREEAVSQPIEEEEDAELYSGNDVPEFTQLLMTTLEENTPHEPWDPELRKSLNDQLTYFLQNNTSTDPEYLVSKYEEYLIQLIQAQTKRLKAKFGLDKFGMLKESGGVKRIINKIPEAARMTFENNKYNPDKKVRKDTVFAEAEYEEEEDERPRSSTPKRPGSTLQLPEAKMAARPGSMTSRNMKQDVVPSEGQVQSQSRGTEDDLEDEEYRMAVEQSKREMFHDPTETPDTGGSAASANPSLESTPQAQSQPEDQSSISKKQLTKIQALFKRACDEVEALQQKMPGAAFTTQDMDRLEYLQPIVVQYRKQMGLLEAKAQAAEESSQQGVTTKRRTDDQGMREKGTKHRTIGATHHGTTSDGRPKSSFCDIGDMFQKGVEEVVSSDPSSATRTPTPIPLTFKESASGLPTEEEVRHSGGDSANSLGLSPTDPRSAKLASDIRSKSGKKSQSTPTQKRGEKTTASTPSSLEELD